MMIARWSIDARFGYMPQVIEAMRRWLDEIGSQVGWGPDRVQLVMGSVGARESTVQTDIRVQDLAELNAAWDKLAGIEAHKQWSRDLEPYVVSGTAYWEVFRVLA